MNSNYSNLARLRPFQVSKAETIVELDIKGGYKRIPLLLNKRAQVKTVCCC
jgi:hypothetical protein